MLPVLANACVGNAIRSCVRLQVLEHQALDLQQKNASLSYLAEHDALTGLKSRGGFIQRLEQLTVSAELGGKTLEVLFIDLDGFKTVNDNFGHGAGDELLKDVSHRLAGLLQGTDCCARFGGDEFALIVENTQGTSSASVRAEKILEVLERPFSVRDMSIVLSASIGIARWGNGIGEGATVEEILKQSDTAMYHAKASGKNCFCQYADSMAITLRKQMMLENAIKLGMEKDEFNVHYQPRFNMVTGEIQGFEALMRWHPSNKEILPEDTCPDVFIAIAETTGSISAIDHLALTQACRQLRAWSDEFNITTRISVNMSAMRLQQRGLIKEVRETLKTFAIEPGMIELELTESAAMDDIVQSVRTLKKLRLLGVDLSIDDFGTGYSSLAYLQKLPVNCLKIDQSFLKGAMVNNFKNSDAEIVKTTIALGKSMGYTMVAEGVEQQAQAGFLVRNGCELAQGFLYSKPLSSTAATSLLRRSCPQADS